MIRNKKECPKCKKHISYSNFNKHLLSCGKFNRISIKIPDNYICLICHKQLISKNSYRSHYILAHTDVRKKITKTIQKRISDGSLVWWNKGKTKETDSRVLNYSNSVKKYYETHPGSFTGKHHTQENKEIFRSKGGYRQGSGRGIKGRYKGFWCDSSWELAFVIYCLDLNKNIIRNTEGFLYFSNGKKRKYFPDFIVDGRYTEIKGYLVDEDKLKFQSFPHQLNILTLNEMKPIIQYVINNYGKDYIKLYEK